MRQLFKKTKETISIKTVVITHPDKDHYNWLTKLFSHKNDKIGFLIFGGLPSHYYQSNQEEFKDWLKLRLKNKTQIFFPAIQYEALAPKDLSNPLQEILELEKNDEFAPHIFSGTTSFAQLALAEAFCFHKKVIISLLAINPLHSGELGNIMRLADDDVDDNKDSLVLRVQHGQSSVLLTGDATQATTRCIRQNYKNNLDSLKSTALLASHHGSAEHGCNSEEWIKMVDPEYVLISHGHQHGHPQTRAYNNFKLSSRLRQVPGHHVLVGKGTNETEVYHEGSLHTTSRAIYSTLNSGTLTLELLPTTLILTPEISPLGEVQKETEKDVKIAESREEILLSVQKPRSRRYKAPRSPTKHPSEEKTDEYITSKEEKNESIVPLISTKTEDEEASISNSTSIRKKKRKVKEVLDNSNQITDPTKTKRPKRQMATLSQTDIKEKKK